MKTYISLKTYIDLGGNPDELDWNESHCNYDLEHYGKIVKAYNIENKYMWTFTFTDGCTELYHIRRISVLADIILNGNQ